MRVSVCMDFSVCVCVCEKTWYSKDEFIESLII